MCAVHDGRCSPWVMCSVVSGNRIHDSYDLTKQQIRSLKCYSKFSCEMLIFILDMYRLKGYIVI